MQLEVTTKKIAIQEANGIQLFALMVPLAQQTVPWEEFLKKTGVELMVSTKRVRESALGL